MRLSYIENEDTQEDKEDIEYKQLIQQLILQENQI